MLNALKKPSLLRSRRVSTPGPGPTAPRQRVRPVMLGLLLRAIALVALAVLPFVVFVRVSVYLHTDAGFPTWAALVTGISVTTLLVTVYAVVISRRLTGRARARMMLKRVALPLVLLYAAYGLWHLSSVNAKTTRVHAQYTSLHPMLRIALGTLVLADRDLVLTAGRRTPQDYQAMGLSPLEASLHYEQPDGYVHAVDLRTSGRGWMRNGLMALYFRAMGFTTLRHVGTADHLHVTLARPSAP